MDQLDTPVRTRCRVVVVVMAMAETPRIVQEYRGLLHRVKWGGAIGRGSAKCDADARLARNGSEHGRGVSSAIPATFVRVRAQRGARTGFLPAPPAMTLRPGAWFNSGEAGVPRSAPRLRQTLRT